MSIQNIESRCFPFLCNVFHGPFSFNSSLFFQVSYCLLALIKSPEVVMHLFIIVQLRQTHNHSSQHLSYWLTFVDFYLKVHRALTKHERGRGCARSCPLMHVCTLHRILFSEQFKISNADSMAGSHSSSLWGQTSRPFQDG
ncbi:uncharacterized protein LOC121747522 [Salvia splendens]|uniref:uncharacterized protein LOC121747522 n=1 Tax=Salvia splendens TaxID=180675 RepID=UPI001C2795D7|nr:uncharacterized protein LOC121747522 [Salvia splendens]